MLLHCGTWIFISECTRGFTGNNGLESRGFESLYTLDDNVNDERLEKYTTNSITTLIPLIKCTKLFGEHFEIKDAEDLAKNDQVLFIGSLILKLYKISDKNTLQIDGDVRYSLDYDKTCTRRYCIIPVSSLINHNCDPNVQHVLIPSTQKCILYSRKPVKKDSQVRK